MDFVRYTRHGRGFPQQGIAGCVVSLMVDGSAVARGASQTNEEVNKHTADCTDQTRTRAHDFLAWIIRR